MPTRSGAQYFPVAMVDDAPVDPPADPPAAAAAAGAGAQADAAGTSAELSPARLFLPKDALKLPKFKGDTDTDTVEDFLFQLELYFDALPSQYGDAVPQALRHRMLILSGCFPAGSVAAVWFRAHYTSQKFTSYTVFRDLFIGQFARHVASIVRLQDNWEAATQRRNQNAYEYYAYLLNLQARIAAVDWQQRPPDHQLLTKFCNSARADLRRFLQEKRIDHPDYTLSQLVQAASVRETTLRASAGPSINAFQSRQSRREPRPAAGSDRMWCFFCNKSNHNAADCRKIAAKKKRGAWREDPPRKE